MEKQTKILIAINLWEVVIVFSIGIWTLFIVNDNVMYYFIFGLLAVISWYIIVYLFSEFYKIEYGHKEIMPKKIR